MKIRKQVNDLTIEDLKKFPIWEFALDEEDKDDQDETTVRPYEDSREIDLSDGTYIVRAVFILADGTIMHGYLNPPTEENYGVTRLHPVVVTEHGQVVFWHGMLTLNEKSISAYYNQLGRDAKHVFPIEARSDVDLGSQPIHITIPGFLVRDESSADRIRVIT